jgi:hypothetical protein
MYSPAVYICCTFTRPTTERLITAMGQLGQGVCGRPGYLGRRGGSARPTAPHSKTVSMTRPTVTVQMEPVAQRSVHHQQVA